MKLFRVTDWLRWRAKFPKLTSNKLIRDLLNKGILLATKQHCGYRYPHIVVKHITLGPKLYAFKSGICCGCFRKEADTFLSLGLEPHQSILGSLKTNPACPLLTTWFMTGDKPQNGGIIVPDSSLFPAGDQLITNEEFSQIIQKAIPLPTSKKRVKFFVNVYRELFITKSLKTKQWVRLP